MRRGAERVGAAIIGGDVAGVPGNVSINVTAVGECDQGSEFVRRSGARPGDRMYVTGWPGRAAAGRRLLLAGHRLENCRSEGVSDATSSAAGDKGVATAPPAASAAQACLRAFLDPMPPVSFGGEVARRGHVGAMMDISDGIGIDLGRMCRASNTGAVLAAAPLFDDPVLRRMAADFDIDVRACVLGGGDDYELLCAVREADAGRLSRRRRLVWRRGAVDRPLRRWVSAPRARD